MKEANSLPIVPFFGPVTGPEEVGVGVDVSLLTFSSTLLASIGCVEEEKAASFSLRCRSSSLRWVKCRRDDDVPGALAEEEEAVFPSFVFTPEELRGNALESLGGGDPSRWAESESLEETEVDEILEALVLPLSTVGIGILPSSAS